MIEQKKILYSPKKCLVEAINLIKAETFTNQNKTCLGRFQDCGRGKGKKYVNFNGKVKE